MRDEERNRVKESVRESWLVTRTKRESAATLCAATMGFNLCPVSRSAKWNLFASLCGTTRFCRSSRRLTRNYK